MKRVAVSNNPGESPLKRHNAGPKPSSDLSDPFAPHLRTTARDVLEKGIGAGTAFLSGRAFMTWPAKSTFKKFQMQTEDGGSVQRFDIKLSGKCKAHFALLDFAATDCFEISLKAAMVEKKQDSSKPYFFPIELEYPEGVLIRWTKRARKPEDNGTIIDTWALDEIKKQRYETAMIAGEENGLTWFTPPESSYPDQLLSTIITSANNAAANSAIYSTPAPPADRAEPPKAAILIPPQTPALPAKAVDRRPASINIKAIVVNATIAGPSKQEKSAAPKPVPKKQSPSDTVSSSRFAVNIGTHFQNPQRPTSTTSTCNPSGPAQRPKQPNDQPRPVSNPASPHIDAPPRAAEPTVTGQNEECSADPKDLAPKLTNKQKRILKKRARELEAQSKSSAASPEASASIAAPSVADVPISPLIEASASVPGATIAAEGQRDPALDIQAGFQCGSESYTPLADINNRGHGLMNIMGLVTSIKTPKKTTTWCTSLTLVDPSILQEDGICGSVEGQGSRINCFTRKYEQWLPSPQIGDVIILRGAKLGGQTLVGYHDHLKWAIFNPEQSKLHHGDRSGAPESEGLADGFGHKFSPFWDAQGPELTACLRYADWWRAVSKIVEKYAGRVHQLGPEDAPSYAARGRTGRVHRLITDASPDQQPGGYFDCTVEIMKGFLNDNGVYSLYVTDYTPNSQMTPVLAEWCPPELGDRILKIEMWDSASALGQTMEIGEYWFLRNCRMKVSRGGYLEGTMQEAQKTIQLEASESDQHPHLAALLQRKSDCEKQNSERDLKFEHRLIGDVEVNGVQYFTCTVEMLHVDSVSCCYVTDYTRHPDLPIIPETDTWARGLERRIVKMILWDGQVDMAKNIEAGNFYTIRNLRLLPSASGDCIQGRLGGAERLINKLRSGDSTNERLATLLQNKQQWEMDRTKIDYKQADSLGTTSTKDHPGNGLTTICEILSSQQCPNKYRTTARIRDFFPFNPNDFVMRRCKYCDKRIDDQYKECRACLDVDSTVKHLFCFFFLLEDGDGQELLVSVSDECALLSGLTPTDLDEGSETLLDLTDRLKPFIGNLFEAHQGISNGEEINKETPTLNMTIDAWQNEGNNAVSYGLVDLQIA